jgi:CDP-glycerol glycerophosphotransferase
MNTLKILVPFYKNIPLLIKCIESIKAQTYTEFEVFLLDDASELSQDELLEVYQAMDHRFVYDSHDVNRGPGLNIFDGMVKYNRMIL